MWKLYCALGLMLTQAAGAAPAVYVISDFEDGQPWPGGLITKAPVHGGQKALLWENLPQNSSLRVPSVPQDWTPWDRLVFWLYSEKANGQMITIVANSENPENGRDWDYYFYHLKIDWTGWRQISLRRNVDLQPSRHPLGWDQIQDLSFHSGGWNHQPLPDTRLVLDDVKLVRDVLRVQSLGKQTNAEGREIVYRLQITSRSDEPLRVGLRLGEPRPSLFSLELDKPIIGPIASQQSAEARVIFRLQPHEKAEPLSWQSALVEIAALNQPAEEPIVMELSAAVPLPLRPHPRLFLSAEEIQQAKERAAKFPWAKAALEGVLAAGEKALALDLAQIPNKGGQWPHYYVCPACGYGLKTLDATHHECPHCKKVYSGWPYDDVVVSSTHSRFTHAIRDLGLAYAFSGDIKYAEKARQILLAYAKKYPTYALHDANNKETRSAGRMYAQTLDEAVSIIPVAWGYDLIYNAPCFSEAEREEIENNYLREACRVIQRNDAGISNWQSWHNAGVAAVGFCLGDTELMAWAINGKSGLRFQLAQSVLPDGFWYEGAISYHFYALDALRWTVEAAYHAGLDFYSNAAYRSLFEAPVLFTFPNGTFPSINDSSGGSLGSQHRLYELAYRRWGEPAFAWAAQAGKRRSLEAFLWGADELSSAEAPILASKDFSGVGAAVLRVGTGEQAAYAHLDYGPHGGGHGHPDKLVLTVFALGQEIAPDPGCLAYAAPMHASWYRQTVAHNALVVDQKSQQPTSGHLELFADWGEAALAWASCDTAYPDVTLQRIVLLTASYLVDMHTASSSQPHHYDYVWHNIGQMTPGMATRPWTEPLGADNGYPHITELTTASGEKDWHVDFQTEKGLVRLWQAGAPGTQLFFGMGMTGRPPQPCPLVLARRQGKEAAFVSVVAWGQPAPDISAIQLLPVTMTEAANGAAYAVRINKGGKEEIFLVGPPGLEKAAGGLKTTARAMFAHRQGNKLLALYQAE